MKQTLSSMLLNCFIMLILAVSINNKLKNLRVNLTPTNVLELYDE
jgi:hypothetical protein